MAITGGCLCGAVRYTVDADPIVTRVCWCRDCQKFGAGSATVNVMFPAKAVRLEGALQDYESVAASGNRMHRGFCPACGTPITTGSEARPHLIGLRAGTLDDPDALPPDIHIFTSSKMPWVVLPEGTPAGPEYYDRKAYWPKESLERRDALMARRAGG